MSHPANDRASRALGEVVAQTLFTRMEDGRNAIEEAEEAIAEILGVALLGIGFDSYDGSFEIYPWREDDGSCPDVAPTQEQHERLLALGCSRYWINFPDGTDRYCRGERKAVAYANRWQAHNSFKDKRRKEEADFLAMKQRAEEAERDARRYRFLRDDAWFAPPNSDGDMVWCVVGPDVLHSEPVDGDELDAAIDRAAQGE